MIRPLVLVLAFAIGFGLHRNVVENHFWRFAPYLTDSAWLGWVLVRGGAMLTAPSGIGGGSFFAVHASLALVPIGAALRLVTRAPSEALALYNGLAGGILAVAVASAALATESRPAWLGAALAIVGAVAVVGLYPVAAIAGYPHIELMIAAAMCLFFEALARGWRRVALASFLLAALVREDGGAQIAGFLITAWVGQKLLGRERRVPGDLRRWAFAGLLVTLCLVSTQRALYGDLATFGRVYAGTPPWAHLTADLLGERLAYLGAHRLYLVLPLLAGPLAALLLRRPALAYGTIAILPWMTLQLVAANEAPGAWRLYYIYPAVPALFWPLVADRIVGAAPAPMLRRFWAPAVALLGLPFAMIGDGPVFAANITALYVPVSEDSHRARLKAADAIAALALSDPDLMIDTHVAALLPDIRSPDRIIGLPADRAVARVGRPTMIAYFRDGLNTADVEQIETEAGLVPRYTWPGTPIVLAARPDAALPSE